MDRHPHLGRRSRTRREHLPRRIEATARSVKRLLVYKPAAQRELAHITAARPTDSANCAIVAMGASPTAWPSWVELSVKRLLVYKPAAQRELAHITAARPTDSANCAIVAMGASPTAWRSWVIRSEEHTSELQ